MSTTQPDCIAALADRYHVSRELVAGGMARVFVATELGLQREVVIKVVRTELLEGVSAERFTREVRLAARLQQANIVPLLTAGETNGTPYYTMPYVRGESLRLRMDAGAPMPVADAVGILRDVARALAFAHGENVVHRDIKPENILLSGRTAVVTDFGIAKAFDAGRTIERGSTLTGVGFSVGTPAYMAPEQAAGDPGVDHRADLYALGVVAWEMLSGRHPFADRATPQQLFAAQMTEVPISLTSVRSDVPLALAALVAQCLAKEPSDRPADAGVLLQALDAISQSPDAVTSDRRITSTAAKSVWVATALVAAIGVAVWVGASAGREPPDTGIDTAPLVSSIAVLPFADLSPGASSTYLGDGVAETLITALARVPGLVVSARTSAFSLRGQADDMRAVGKALDVAAVLTGSIQRAGDQLRITARVVRVSSNTVLWSNAFDRPIADIFAVQDEVANAVTDALRPRLGVRTDSGAVISGISGTANTAAYDAYLLGRYYWNLRTTDGMRRAAVAFNQAIAADSTFAQAWSGLADTYALSIPGEYNVSGLPRDSLLHMAERAARRAIKLQPQMAEGYASLGETLGSLRQFDEALASLERAVALNPSYATGHQWYSYALLSLGAWDRGVAEMERAHRLDPLAPVITLSLAAAYDGANRFADAAPLYAQGLAQAPAHWYAWRFRVNHDLGRHDLAAAHAAVMEAVKDSLHPMWRSWRDLAAIGADSASWAAAADAILRRGDWDLGIPLVRWLRGDSVVVAHAAAALANGQMIGEWGANGLLGPQLRADPRMQKITAAAGFPNMKRSSSVRVAP